VLLASHGSAGARAAEAAAIALLADGGRLHHLLVVPELWQGMSGDGWRINASTEREFCDYLEGQIERETVAELKRVADAAARRGIAYSASSECGPLEATLAAVAAKGGYDAVVIGAPRPKGMTGLRSRLKVDVLMRMLAVPLIVVPHPGAEGS
jgi:nucleotide-binding universal stress UspA family protein